MSILDLEAIHDWQLDGRVKGFPGTQEPLPLREIGGRGWNLFEGRMPFPAAVLKRTALQRNSRWMRRFLQETGTRLAPHGKTTMSPQLFEMQLQDGAWGMTCATVEQLHVYRSVGVQRVLMANQLVGAANIEYVVAELNRDERFEFYCVVDSVEGIRHLVTEAKRFGLRRPISLLVEFGVAGGRTGVRTPEAAVELAREIANHQLARLAGFETYERIVPAGSADETEARARSLLEGAVQAIKRLDAEGCFRGIDMILLSAGGTDFFDMAAALFGGLKLSKPTLPIIRSGCYLTLDHLNYTEAFSRLRRRGLAKSLHDDGLIPALEIWACVQSRPDPTRAFATMGKRDVSYDLHMPTPLAWVRPGEGGVRPFEPGAKVTGLNDQHAYLELPADSPLRVGDLVGFGISHPCTTFDKWQLIYVVDDDYRIVDAIRTFF